MISSNILSVGGPKARQWTCPIIISVVCGLSKDRMNYEVNPATKFQDIPSKPLTLDIFFREACYYQNAFHRKINGIKVVDELSIGKVGSVHFWRRIHPTKLRIFQEIVQSIHEFQS